MTHLDDLLVDSDLGFDSTETLSLDTPIAESVADSPVMQAFLETVQRRRLRSTVEFDPLERIGSCGEGYVFRAVRHGADGFSAVTAVKIFTPAVYPTIHDYQRSMERVGQVASRIAQVQQENIVDIFNFNQRKGIRFMVMEWIDGFDLSKLMSLMKQKRFQKDVGWSLGDGLSEVIGKDSDGFRFTPGITIHIVRECLSGLAALHRAGVVHDDIKPSNIMLDRNGCAKLVDIGSADSLGQNKRPHALTPIFAAPELLMGGSPSRQSDLASLGYTLITMLTGRIPLVDVASRHELSKAKQSLPATFEEILPEDVRRCKSIVSLCKHLIASNLTERLESSEQAIRRCDDVQRQLVLASLDCDYRDCIRRWMDRCLAAASKGPIVMP